MTRKVAQNTRPSFSYMREGLGMRLAHLIFLCVEEPGYEATCFRSGNETMIIPFLLAERQIIVPSITLMTQTILIYCTLAHNSG